MVLFLILSFCLILSLSFNLMAGNIFKGDDSPYISFGYLVIVLSLYLPSIQDNLVLRNSWISNII